MFKAKVLFVGENSLFVNVFHGVLAENKIDITYCCYDSSKVINSILSNGPHFVVLDDFSYNDSAIDIVRCINASSLINKPHFLLSVNRDEESSLPELQDIGAFSFLPNPVTAESLINSVFRFSYLSLSSSGSLMGGSNFLEAAVTEVIHKIGVPANIMGYHYLRAAVIACVENSQNLHAITKLLYPTVAKQFDTTASRVERAIRHSIEATWCRGNPDAIHVLFGYRPNTHYKPSNSEFIAMITDNIRIKMKHAL